MEKITEEYRAFLTGLKRIDINEFLSNVKNFKRQDNYFKDIGGYLNNYFCEDTLNIWDKEEFIKIFYLEPQAQFLLKCLNLKEEDLDYLKTLVYCYNHNQREFKERLELKRLEEDLFKRGFVKVSFSEDKPDLNNLKVICVMDISKIGVLGSFDNKEEIEGRLVYSDYHKNLMLIPKRSRTRGHIIRGDFYYKIK